MAKTTADVSAKLEASGSTFSKLDVQTKLETWAKLHFQKLAALARGDDEARKVFVVCMNTISKNPNLLSCTFESLCNCVLQSFELNLFPGAFQECGYVPLKNGRLSFLKKTDVYEANFWPQYQGIVKLMRNAGNQYVQARVVFEGDMFQYGEGDRPPKYVPAVVLGKERGAPLFAYAVVGTSSGWYQVEVMSIDQIMVIKQRSPAGRDPKNTDSPWNSKYEDDRFAMWAKCPLKRVSKWCTKSPELARAIELDNVVDGDPTLQSQHVLPEMNFSGPASGETQPDATPALPAPTGATVVLPKNEPEQLKTVKPEDSKGLTVQSEDVPFSY